MGKSKEVKEILNKKTKQITEQAFEGGAKVVDAVDGGKENCKHAMSRFSQWLFNLGALIITGIDNLLILMERGFLNLKYKFLSKKHSLALFIRDNTREMAIYFTGVIVVSILLLAVLNMYTGYEYSYRGRMLGVVKNEDDVAKVVNLVNRGLSQKYDKNVNISTEKDMTFQKTYSVKKDVDDSDTVLKRLSNMTDTRTEAYAIKVNNKDVVHTETEKEAKDVLDKVVAKYVKPQDQKKFESIGFVEDVQVVRDDTIIPDIKTEDAAFNAIMSGDKNEAKYTIKEDDAIADIAQRGKTSVGKLEQLNPDMDPEDLEVGDEIVIKEAIPSITVKAVGVQSYNQSIEYQTVYQDDASMYEGNTDTYRNGVYGVKGITSRITYYNGKKVAEQVLNSRIERQPVAKIILRGTKERPPTVGSGSFAWPSTVHTVTGFYGYEPGHYNGFHSGIDISGMGYGAPITAADGGTVTTAGVYGGYGNCVIIDHQNGYETLYGHNSSLAVSVGDKVYKGQTIAYAGSTGFSFCVHCHFEIHKGGSTVNPLDYLP